MCPRLSLSLSHYSNIQRLTALYDILGSRSVRRNLGRTITVCNVQYAVHSPRAHSCFQNYNSAKRGLSRYRLSSLSHSRALFGLSLLWRAHDKPAHDFSQISEASPRLSSFSSVNVQECSGPRHLLYFKIRYKEGASGDQDKSKFYEFP